MSRRSLAVLIPSYNHGAFIGRALDGILAQSRLPDVCIVLDDCSTDDSAAIIAGYVARYPWIRLVQHPRNEGVVKTLADLLAMCTADYFIPAGADDYLLEGLLSESMALLERHPEAAFCSALSLEVNAEGESKGLVPCGIPTLHAKYLSPAYVRRALCRHGAWFMGNTTIFQRDKFVSAGGYRADLGAFADGFISHVLALRHGACFIPRPLAAWRNLPTSYSRNTAARQDKILSVLSRADALMTTEPSYAGLFPEKYIRDWKRRQRYWMELPVLQQRQSAAGAGWSAVAKMRYWMGLVVLQLRCFTWPATPLMVRWAALHAASLWRR